MDVKNRRAQEKIEILFEVFLIFFRLNVREVSREV